MPAAPELESVAMIPISRGIAAVGDLFGRRLFNPCSWYDMPAVPLARLEVKLAKLRDVLRANLQPPAAQRHALRAESPLGFLDAQRLEQPRT